MSHYQPQDDLSDLSAMFVGGGSPATAPTPEDPAKRRRRRRTRRIVGIVAAGLVVALVATYSALALTAPVGAAAASIHRPDVDVPAAVALAMPQEGETAVSISGAGAYLGPKADGIFASKGGNGQLPMASISKLITALIVLQARPLGASGKGPTITFGKADHALYDKYFALNATIAAMPLNSSMSEYDALETMLVVSACNYAEAIATWAYGSDAAFVGAARTWLTAHRLHGTVMVEPTGIDARNVSSPADLIKLGKLVMAVPALARIVAKKSLDVPSLRGLPSTNNLLGTDGVDGIKTGTLDQSNLLFSSTVSVGLPKPLVITGVVLGGDTSASVDIDVKALIESITSGFHTEQLGDTGQVVGTYSTPWGAKASMVLARGASALTWSNAPISSTIKTTTLKTGASGETVGSVTWKAGPTTVTVPVILRGKIQGPSAWWRLTHPFELLGK